MDNAAFVANFLSSWKPPPSPHSPFVPLFRSYRNSGAKRAGNIASDLKTTFDTNTEKEETSDEEEGENNKMMEKKHNTISTPTHTNKVTDSKNFRINYKLQYRIAFTHS